MPADTPQLEPSILIIFGITGDLAKRKVLPALYHLFKDNLLHPQTFIVGTSRRELTVEDLLKEVELCVLEVDNICDPDVIHRLREHMSMAQVDPDKAADFTALKASLQTIEDAQGVCMHRLFYLSIPPQAYAKIVEELGQQGLNKGCKHGDGHSRLLVEKPFGYDLASGEELIKNTHKYFDESQTFRIDHFLAKETAQNILTFRQQNPLFSSIWNGDNITSVEITASEKLTIEGRANFYDEVGALRDLVQSHLMQLLALTTMPLPDDASSQTQIHRARQTLLESLQPPAADQMANAVVRGQYNGYRQEVKQPDSTTETYVSLLVHSNLPQWEGVPFRLTTGKALATKRTAIEVTFGKGATANHLSLRIQPNEGIDVVIHVKKPGFSEGLETTILDFDYKSAAHPDAYERVLVDAIRGDQLLFATDTEVLASWKVLQPIIDHWKTSSDDLQTYDIGSAGPNIKR